MLSIIGRNTTVIGSRAFVPVLPHSASFVACFGKRFNASDNKKNDSEKPSLLKLDALLEGELKKASKKRAFQNDSFVKDDFSNLNSITDSATKVFLNKQIYNNLKITRGVKGGSQIKVNNNTTSMLNNNLGILSQNILSTENDDFSSLESQDEYGTLKTSKKLRIAPRGNIVVTKSLSSGLMHLTRRQQQNNLRFNLKLRDRHMRPSKVKRAQKTRVSAKKFDAGWADYMGVVHAMIRRGYT
ncbi:hypothetical protein QEN19_003441 [Hanseniaspora menglaensis]